MAQNQIDSQKKSKFFDDLKMAKIKKKFENDNFQQESEMNKHANYKVDSPQYNQRNDVFNSAFKIVDHQKDQREQLTKKNFQIYPAKVIEYKQENIKIDKFEEFKYNKSQDPTSTNSQTYSNSNPPYNYVDQSNGSRIQTNYTYPLKPPRKSNPKTIHFKNLDIQIPVDTISSPNSFNDDQQYNGGATDRTDENMVGSCIYNNRRVLMKGNFKFNMRTNRYMNSNRVEDVRLIAKQQKYIKDNNVDSNQYQQKYTDNQSGKMQAVRSRQENFY